MTATSTPAVAPLVTGVDFVVVPVRDFAVASHFYGEVLGLPCSARYGDMPGAEFETGTVTLSVLQLDAFGGGEARPGTGAIALRVEDIAAARAALEAQGVAFSGGVDSGTCHQAYFSDPDGNRLILHQRYAPRGAAA
jgi:catechol 2,3-dioxygenase-like lactoylglutathione lyase family enzyme